MRALLWVALISSAGCLGSEDWEVLSTEQGVQSSNAMTSNALTSNALTSNALTSNALTSNALTSNALTSNALTSNALRDDPLAREFFYYLYSCAMPAGAVVSLDLAGASYQFEGQLGLAPDWGAPGGSCDQSCQRWITSCLLARTNALGVRVDISIRGAHPAIRTVSRGEAELYPYREAAFFGNLFDADSPMYGCEASVDVAVGSHWSDIGERVCGSGACGFVSLGQCAINNAPSPCNERGSHGFIVNCTAPDGVGYEEVITTFLDPTVDAVDGGWYIN